MRKRVRGRKLGRNTNSRIALLRSLSRGLILEGSIKTTLIKAKFLKPEIDSLMAKASKGTLEARRAVLASLGNDRKLTDALYHKYATLLKNKKSGFVRIKQLPPRRGDNAKQAQIEFVETK